MDEAVRRFRWFCDHGGKLRVAITDVCNLDCFFCHNEGMPNPRRLPLARDRRLGDRELAAIINAMCALGAPQVNITGGEPLAHPGLFELLAAVDKRQSRLVMNTNGLLARRLLSRPRVEAIDQLLVSLHTTDDDTFRREMGAKSASAVMDAMVALAAHGYRIAINYSLGDYNARSFSGVLEFALRHALDLKVITLVRHDHAQGFYRSGFVDPARLESAIAGAVRLDTQAALGGVRTSYRTGDSTIEIKNIAAGRARTDMCRGCGHAAGCGEGVYGLRVGVDGRWKPCLLAREQHRPVRTDVSYEEQILAVVHDMVGEPTRMRLEQGPPC